MILINKQERTTAFIGMGENKGFWTEYYLRNREEGNSDILGYFSFFRYSFLFLFSSQAGELHSCWYQTFQTASSRVEQSDGRKWKDQHWRRGE